MLEIRVEHDQGDRRDVEGAKEVADVVTRALLGDAGRLHVAGGRILEKEARQALLAIPNRFLVNFEHVPELEVVVRAFRLDEQKIGLERAMLERRALPRELPRV